MSEGFDRPFTASKSNHIFDAREGQRRVGLSNWHAWRESSHDLEWALNEGMCPEDRRDAYAHVGEFHFESPPWQQERFLGRVECILHSNPLNLPSSPFAWTDAARTRELRCCACWSRLWGKRVGKNPTGETASDETKLEAPLGIPIASDVYQVPCDAPCLCKPHQLLHSGKRN